MQRGWWAGENKMVTKWRFTSAERCSLDEPPKQKHVQVYSINTDVAAPGSKQERAFPLIGKQDGPEIHTAGPSPLCVFTADGLGRACPDQGQSLQCKHDSCYICTYLISFIYTGIPKFGKKKWLFVVQIFEHATGHEVGGTQKIIEEQ